MALIDTVRCSAKVPVAEVLGDREFQTKTFGCRFDRFTIDGAGRLIHPCRIERTVPLDDRPFEYRDIVVPIHRDVRLFGPDAMGTFRAFCARLTDGILQWGKFRDELTEEQREYAVTIKS